MEVKQRIREMGDLMDFLGAVATRNFSYSDYANGEEKILKPALLRRGYTDVRFVSGEKDSFGPLSRICYAKLKDRTVRFWYG